MKKVIIIILLIINKPIVAQTLDELYFSSLKSHIEATNKYEVLDSQKTYFVKHISHITEHFPDSINGYKICYITDLGIRKKAKKPFNLIEIIPIQLNEGELQISTIDFRAIIRKRKLNLENLGGNIFYYRFDCDSYQYKLKKNSD